MRDIIRTQKRKLGKFRLSDYIIAQKLGEERKILDVGCIGDIQMHKKLQAINHNGLVGIDINKKALSRLEEKDVYYYDIQKTDQISDLISKFGTFDFIVMTEVIEHLENLYDTLENIYKLLNRDGLILISTPNALSLRWLYQVNEMGYTDTCTDHIMWFDKQTLERLFLRHGFKVYQRITADMYHRLVMLFCKK